MVGTDRGTVSPPPATTASAHRAPYLVIARRDDLLEPTYLQQAPARLDSRPGARLRLLRRAAFGGGEPVWFLPRPSSPPCRERRAARLLDVSPALWEAVGGFDERLRMLEDLGCWLAAHRRGVRGVVLPEPLLRYRVRLDSLHHRGVRTGEQQTVMRQVLAKHRPALEAEGTDLLLAMQGALHSRFAHQRAPRRERRSAIEGEIAAMRPAISDAAATLRGMGEEPLELGDPPQPGSLRRPLGVSSADSTRPLLHRALLDSHRDDIAGRVLEVRDSQLHRAFGGGASPTRR